MPRTVGPLLLLAVVPVPRQFWAEGPPLQDGVLVLLLWRPWRGLARRRQRLSDPGSWRVLHDQVVVAVLVAAAGKTLWPLPESTVLNRRER